MAKRLLDAGHDVDAYDPNAEAVAALVGHGARRRARPPRRRRARRSSSAASPTRRSCAQAIAGDGGVLEGAAAGRADHRLQHGRSGRGARAGRRRRRARRRLSRRAGEPRCRRRRERHARRDGRRRARGPRERAPVLDQLATDIVHVGGVGAGQVTKLCNNMLTAIITTALGEVLVTGVKAGVELEPLTAALGAGSAGNYVLSGYLPNTLFTEERAAGFALALMRKDLGPVLKAARDAGWSCRCSTSRSALRRGARPPASTTRTPPASPSSTSARPATQLEPIAEVSMTHRPSPPRSRNSRRQDADRRRVGRRRGRRPHRGREPVAARGARAACPAAPPRTSTARSRPRRRRSGAWRALPARERGLLLTRIADDLAGDRRGARADHRGRDRQRDPHPGARRGGDGRRRLPLLRRRRERAEGRGAAARRRTCSATACASRSASSPRSCPGTPRSCSPR